MARRRFNFRFAILSGCIVSALAAGGGYLVIKHRRPHDPVRLIAAGDQAFIQQDYDRAVTNYLGAAEVLQNDAALHVKLAKAYFLGRKPGTDSLSNAVTEFTKAEEIDPASKDAWGGLLETSELRVEYWEAKPGDARDREQLPMAINTAKEAADHLVKLDPTNLDARTAAPILILRVWLLNLAMPETTADRDQAADKRLLPSQRADQAISELTKLMREHPESDKIPYWIARAKIYQATQALHGDQPENAAPLFAEAATEFDQSIAARPDVVGLYLNKAMVIQQLQGADPSGAVAPQYRAALRDTLDKAQAIADPKSPQQYLMAKQQWAWVLSSSEPARAEAVYRNVIKQFPDNIVLRMALARLLQRDASRRADALAMLDAIPTLPGSSVSNAQQREQWAYNVARSKLIRSDIEVDQLSSTPQGKARENLISDIRTSLDTASKPFAGTPELLRVRGRFDLAIGDAVDAIQTLTQAADKMSVTGGAVDFDLLRLEASAYAAGGQTGKAIELLERAMVDPAIANNDAIHTTLAQLHLQNQDPVRAKPYIDWLAVRFPGDPRIIVLQIADLGPNGDPKAVHALYAQLPEKTPDQIRSKYGTARQINDRPEQVRLLSLMNQSNPGDIQLAFELAQRLKEAGRVDDALAALEKCKTLNADQVKPLQIMEDAIKGGSAVSVQSSEEDLISGVKDPFERAIKMASLRESEQRPEDEIAELQKAAAIQPDNTDVLQQIFIMHMGAGRFAQAESMLPHLTELNADQSHGLMLRCRLSLAKQDFNSALIASRQLTHDFPDFAGSWELYGESLADTGQLDLACQQFVTALALQGTNIDARKRLIQCSVMEGKLDDAKAYIKQARERYPDDQAYLEMNVGYEINWGDPESVLPDVNAAIEKHPGDRRNYALGADAMLAAMRARAVKGDADGAADFLAKAKALFQLAIKSWPDDLRFANGLAQMDLQSHDLPAAEDALKTISQRPRWRDQPAPLILLARVYVGASKLDLAESALNAALKYNPKSVDALMVLADCKIMQSKPEEAVQVLVPVVATFAVREKYTDLLIALNKSDQAEVELTQAIHDDPTNNALVNLRLHVYDAQGRYEQGLRAANEAIHADGTNIWAYYWRGKFIATSPKPDYEAALKDLSFFRDSLPTDVKGRSMLAAILDAKGDHDSALHELETALTFAPQDRQVRLSLLRDYLAAVPPHTLEAAHLLTQTLALPSFAHDPEFESKAALVWAQKGESDKAMAAIRDAMEHASDKGALVHDYFTVLLATKNYDLLISESNAYVANPKSNSFIFNDRAMALAYSGRYTEAAAEFETALNRCSIETGTAEAGAIVASIAQTMGQPGGPTGVQKALELVLPRAQNSVAWKMIAVNLYIRANDIPNGVKVVESALPSVDSLPTHDKLTLLQQASALYMNSSPPQGEKAMSIYDKMLKINPDDVSALNDMACILIDMTTPPRPKDALAYSQRAYDITESSGAHDRRVMDTQGWILIQIGKIEQGIDILHRSVDQSDFPEAHYHLAIGYLRMKPPFPEEAQRQLDKAKELIQSAAAQKSPLDATLTGKIDDAVKQIDQMSKDKPSVSAAP